MKFENVISGLSIRFDDRLGVSNRKWICDGIEFENFGTAVRCSMPFGNARRNAIILKCSSSSGYEFSVYHWDGKRFKSTKTLAEAMKLCAHIEKVVKPITDLAKIKTAEEKHKRWLHNIRVDAAANLVAAEAKLEIERRELEKHRAKFAGLEGSW